VKRLTLSRTPDYGSHLVHHVARRSAPLLLACLAAACGSSGTAPLSPLDRFHYPVGVAVRGPVGQEQLLVASSNYDLAYDRDEGGVLFSIAPEASPQDGLAVEGTLRMGSFGGELALAEADACGLPQPLALVASRATRQVYKVALGAGGSLTCGADCPQLLPEDFLDPFGVTVACREARRPRAFVTARRTDRAVSRLVEIDLATGAQRVGNFGYGTTHSVAYDAALDRIYFTSSADYGSAALRYVDVTPWCDPPLYLEECHADVVNVGEFVRGADLGSIALSNANVDADGKPMPRRLYIGARLFDPDLAASLGWRPGFDTGGVLIVLEVDEAQFGVPAFRFIGAIPVGFGPAEVRVLPRRPGKRDVVAVTVSDEGLLWIYDDDVGAMARVFGRDDVTGAPLLGRVPYGIAVQDRGTSARLYVSAFDSSYVTPVDVPLDNPGEAAILEVADPNDPTRQVPRRLGQERP
jgi:hypothetical protein